MDQEINNNADNLLASEQKLFEDALNTCDTGRLKKIISGGFYVNQILEDLPPLSLALSKGLFEAVDVLLSSGADASQLDASGKFCPMFYAIKNRCPKSIIRRLILAGAAVDEVVEYNYRSTALHLAVYGNQKSVIKFLLSLSANVNVKDINGATPLHAAVQTNHPNIVKILVSKGANPDAENDDKFTPLMFAIHDNNYKMVDLLISLGSDVNYEPKEPKYSYQKPLNYAAGLGLVEIIRLLLKNKADGKPTSEFNDSPLHSIAYSNSEALSNKSAVQEVIQLLLEHGAELDGYNKVGQTPLHSAIISKNTIVAKSLLKAGASCVQKTITFEDTPLHLAAYVGDSAMVRLLLNSGADRATTNRVGLIPYDLALKQKDEDTVRALWSHNQPPDDMKFESEESIDVGIKRLIVEQKKFINAIKFGAYSQLVDALENGAEPKGCGLTLKYPLHLSVYRGDEEIVHELLERGVPVGKLNGNGETALHVACRAGNVAICLDLLAHGACYNAVSRLGKTTYQIARAKKRQGVMQCLKCIDLLFHFKIDVEGVYTLMKSFEEMKELLSKRDDEEVRLLLVNACLNCVDSKGNTLLGKSLLHGIHVVTKAVMAHRIEETLNWESPQINVLHSA